MILLFRGATLLSCHAGGRKLWTGRFSSVDSVSSAAACARPAALRGHPTQINQHMIFRRADRHRGNPTTTSNRATRRGRLCTAPTASNECDSSAKTSPRESRPSPNTAAKEHVRTLISPNVKDGQLKPITLDQMATDTTISASRNHRPCRQRQDSRADRVCGDASLPASARSAALFRAALSSDS